MHKSATRFCSFFFLLVAAISLAGCNRQNSSQINYGMGDRIQAGPLIYNVIQAEWKGQLGELGGTGRFPQNRFLVLQISATNGGGREVSIPMLTLEGANNTEYREIESGEGVPNWFGLLRTISPAETRQGNIVFDVPLTSYRLRLTDGGEPGTEKFVWVDIPLRIDTDAPLGTPVPGSN